MSARSIALEHGWRIRRAQDHRGRSWYAVECSCGAGQVGFSSWTAAEGWVNDHLWRIAGRRLP